MSQYQFKYSEMEFSKDGQLDELIALDRYAVPAYDNYQIGDILVAITDTELGSKSIGVIKEFTKIEGKGGFEDAIVIEDRLGNLHTVLKEHTHKPLETRPVQLWERWAKGGAIVEKTPELKEYWENRFRKLMDGFGYSLGGRIQLMLGQEFVTGEKANLTAYNCYVAPVPKSLYDVKKLTIEGKVIFDTTNKEAFNVSGFSDSLLQFLEVMRVAQVEANIMRRGGGVGINISEIQTIKGSGLIPSEIIFYLDESHKDYNELLKRIKLNKFKGVTVIATKQEYEKYINSGFTNIQALDDVNGLFQNQNEMVIRAFQGEKIIINFNDLRERDAIVHGVNGRSSGSVSWMELFALIARLLQQETINDVEFAEIFSAIVGLIIQGGSRRGALMIIKAITDAINRGEMAFFIERKKETDEFGKGKWLTGANISVGISDGFMSKVKLGKELRKQGGVIPDNITEALLVWDILVQSAWQSAEPGIVWMERYNKESNSWYFHPIVCTNPCGEQGLPEWGVCNLGHFVLPRYYNEETNDVDWDALKEAVHTAVRLQDNIIDYTKYFIPENEETQKRERRVGIGSLGLGTLMIRLGKRYGTDNDFVDKLYKFIAIEAYKASIDIAEEKGAFPAFDAEKMLQSGFMQRLFPELPKEYQDKFMKTGIRNVTILTQAPTGSTGTYIDNIPLFREWFGGTTTGIEPYFNWDYWRAGRLGFSHQVVHIAQDYMSKHGLTSVDELPDYFVTAMNLSPEDHVRVQAAVQKWTDSSISKTANCPNDYTIEQTDELYMLSYDLGLKGMTIYRDGCREAQVLATNKEDAKLEFHIEAEKLKEMESVETKTSQQATDEGVTNSIKKVPSRLYGMREKVRYQSGEKISKAYIHVYTDEEFTPVEVWIEPTDIADKDMADALGRMTTQFLRFGNTSDNVAQAVKHLKKGKTMMSLPFIVGRLINDIYYGKIKMPTFEENTETTITSEIITPKKKRSLFIKCSECGEEAYDKTNCICHACGQSKCN